VGGRVELAGGIVHHDGAADLPLAEQLPPGGLGPSGVGQGPVQVGRFEVLPELGGDDMADAVGGLGVRHHFRKLGGSRGEVDEHDVIGAGLFDVPRAEPRRSRAGQALVALPPGSIASDADGDQLVYSASNLPDGASFDPNTRTFSWTPRYDQAGVYSVRFEVTDGQSTDYEDVTITIIQLYEDWDVNGDDAVNVFDMGPEGTYSNMKFRCNFGNG